MKNRDIIKSTTNLVIELRYANKQLARWKKRVQTLVNKINAEEVEFK